MTLRTRTLALPLLCALAALVGWRLARSAAPPGSLQEDHRRDVTPASGTHDFPQTKPSTSLSATFAHEENPTIASPASSYSQSPKIISVLQHFVRGGRRWSQYQKICEAVGCTQSEWRDVCLLADAAREDTLLFMRLKEGMSVVGAKRLREDLQAELWGSPSAERIEGAIQRMCALVLAQVDNADARLALIEAFQQHDTPEHLRHWIPFVLTHGVPWDASTFKEAERSWNSQHERAMSDPNYAACTPVPRRIYASFDGEVSLLAEPVTNEGVVRALLRLAQDETEDPSVRRAVVAVLRWSMKRNPFEPDSLREDLMALSDADSTRQAALRSLVEDARPRMWSEYLKQDSLEGLSLDALGAILTDASQVAGRRKTAILRIALAVREAESPDAGVALLMPVATGDSSPQIRQSAIGALVDLIPDASTVPAVSAFLRSLRYDHDPMMRVSFMGSARRILKSDEETRQVLWDMIRRDESAEVRLNGLTIIEPLLDESAAPTLREIAEKDPDEAVRIGASQILDAFPRNE